jgi:uncharacterized repeat protein (TIGR02543 family)
MQHSLLKVATLVASLILGILPNANALQSDSQNDTIEVQVVGGTPVSSMADAPWQVALISATAGSNNDGQFCGGSIIAREWIVTAAHCVDGSTTINDFVILAGEPNLSQTGPVSGIAVEEINLCPHWLLRQIQGITGSNYCDVAVLKLAEPLVYSAGQIEAIALPPAFGSRNNESELPTGTIAKISGWGSTWFNSPYTGNDWNFNGTASKFPTRLQVGIVEIYRSDTPQCQSVGNLYNANAMICAGSVDYLIDGCQGDSGGPLAMFIEGKWELIGVTSWGNGCAWDTPGVYTSMRFAHDWIRGIAVLDSYKVTFNSMGGSAVPASSFIWQGSIPEPERPIRPGYTFSYWSNAENGLPVSFPNTPDSKYDRTFYAVWAVNPVVSASNPVAAPPVQAQVVGATPETVSAKQKYSTKSLAAQAGVVMVSKNATVSVSVAKESKKVCAKSGSNIKTLKPGNCVLIFTIQEPKPKKGKKPKATKSVKTLVVQ